MSDATFKLIGQPCAC